MLARVERERLGDRQGLVGQGVQFRVVAVQRQDGGAGLPCVVDPLKQRNGGGVLRHDKQGLAPAGRLQPGESDRQVRGRAGRGRPADERGRELRDAGQPVVVQVRRHVPRLELGRAHHEQSARRPG